MTLGIASRPLTVLHVLDHSLPLHSGYAFRSREIFRAQEALGWRPVAVTSPRHEEEAGGPALRAENVNGITYYRSEPVPRSGVPLLGEARLMGALERRIQEVAPREKPSLLHVHSPVLNAIPALRAARRLALPVVYEIRAFWEDAAASHGTYREGSLKYRLVRGAETWACRNAARVVVICQGLRNDLVRRGIPEDRIHVAMNGVNPEELVPREGDPRLRERLHLLAGKSVVGFIGSFYRYEGLDLLVEAFALLAGERRDLALLLVGGGPMERDLRSQVERLGLADRVVFAGRIEHEAIPGVYGLVDILAYPRYSCRVTELVTPLKPLEAMCLGKALVASDVGGHRELIQDQRTGLLFPPDSASALAGAIRTLLHDASLRERMVRQAMQWVRDTHTWTRTTAVYSEVYERTLQPAGDRR